MRKTGKQTTQLRKTIGGDGNRQVDINGNPPKKTRLSQEKGAEQKEKNRKRRKRKTREGERRT